MENLKPGTVLCCRSWNYHRREYCWIFEKVRKITPTGKIRLENDELLSSLGCYTIYDDEMKELYLQDNIQKNVMKMIRYFGEEGERLAPKLTISDIVKIGDFLESLKLENVDGWGREHTKDWYKNALNYFIGYRNELQKNRGVDKSKLENAKQCLNKILEEKEELEELNDRLDSVSYGLSQSITNLRNVIEIIDAKLEDL